MPNRKPRNLQLGVEALLNSDADFVLRLRMSPEEAPRINWGDGSYSSHYMSSGVIDGQPAIFPEIYRDPLTGYLIWNPINPLVTAEKYNDYVVMPDDETANYLASNHYKKYFPATLLFYNDTMLDLYAESLPESEYPKTDDDWRRLYDQYRYEEDPIQAYKEDFYNITHIK